MGDFTYTTQKDRCIGSFYQWQDARLTAEMVATVLHNHLSSLYRVVVSKFTDALGNYEWELTLATGVFLADQDDRLGTIRVRKMVSYDLDMGREVVGVGYGYGTPRVIPPDWDKELLRDIFVQGKMKVDDHFGFDSEVSNETPWDAESDRQKREILKLWHPLGKRLMAGEIVDRMWGDADGIGTRRVTPEEKRRVLSQRVTHTIYELRKKHGTDIVPYKHK